MIFVTGGAGFIGRHLVDSLILGGHKVTIFDNLSNSSKKLIFPLLDKGVKFVEGDITNKNEIFDNIVGSEVVIHLAAKISVEDSILNPEQTMKVNVDGTINLINSCMEHNIENFIVASSAAVYGELNDHSQILTEEPKTDSLSPYGESKLTMERVIRKNSKDYNTNSIILRLFNVYGFGQTNEYAGVISKFANNIKENKPLEIFGDGYQTRDFVAVQDVVNSIFNSIECLKGKRGNVYNIANGKYVTIKDLANTMILVSGKNIGVKYFPPKKGDIRHSQASINLAKMDLGYNPTYSLKKGIEELFRKLKII